MWDNWVFESKPWWLCQQTPTSKQTNAVWINLLSLFREQESAGGVLVNKLQRSHKGYISTRLHRGSYFYKTIAITAIKYAFSITWQKLNFMDIFLLYQNETLQTSTGGVPSLQHLTFSWPGTIRTNPILLLKHGFYKCKKVGWRPVNDYIWPWPDSLGRVPHSAGPASLITLTIEAERTCMPNPTWTPGFQQGLHWTTNKWRSQA